MLALYLPQYCDLWFRQQFLADPETMTYNHAWGGTIDFSEDKWPAWYEKWVCCKDGKRFYRYLLDTSADRFVGEIAYHRDEQECVYLIDIIIPAALRGQGFGKAGLLLLMDAAKHHGIKVLYNAIALDNPSIQLFLKNGFIEERRTKEAVFLKKVL